MVLIARSEGSLSGALMGTVVEGGVDVNEGAVLASVEDCIGVCAFVSVSSSSSPSSLLSCWYMSSTMGFHNRTRAFMNQFDT